MAPCLHSSPYLILYVRVCTSCWQMFNYFVMAIEAGSSQCCQSILFDQMEHEMTSKHLYTLITKWAFTATIVSDQNAVVYLTHTVVNSRTV